MSNLQNCDNREHEFAGRHLVISYVGCVEAALRDQAGILSEMKKAIEASGASLLKFSEHSFDGGGYTAVMLLSESHASIHTYPEFQSCFLDIFTCGAFCEPEAFERVMRAYLQPKSVSIQAIIRQGELTVVHNEGLHAALESSSARLVTI